MYFNHSAGSNGNLLTVGSPGEGVYTISGGNLDHLPRRCVVEEQIIIAGPTGGQIMTIGTPLHSSYDHVGILHGGNILYQFPVVQRRCSVGRIGPQLGDGNLTAERRGDELTIR